MARIILILISVFFALPAAAHSLKVFAKVDGSTVNGYAFFIGGGRPMGVTWVAKMGGKTIATGKTGHEGEYDFTVPDPVTDGISITVDTGEGHIATTTLNPDRFSMAMQPPSAVTSSEGAPGAQSIPTSDETAKLVEQAVERQVGPLLVRIEEMDARMRFTDIMSGIFLIIGLAGITLWARGRKH
ncbi:nickel transport protein [Agrobacterium vitis]|nr:nickel transport protein [Agrobacterium vitis]MBE1440451.1 nickel transport protein [Agrobacterium vitis]